MIATNVLDSVKCKEISISEVLNQNSTTSTTTTGITAKCAICGDASHGMHFGVSACRACAAFFRRSTISNRKYQCRFGGNCEIGKDVRCCCRACRMAKCLSLGMNADSVQRHRDHIGPRKRHDESTENNEYEQDNQPILSRNSSTNSGYSSPVINNNNSNNIQNVQLFQNQIDQQNEIQMTFLENGKSYTLLSGVSPNINGTFYEQQPSTSVISSIYTPSIIKQNSAFTPIAQQQQQSSTNPTDTFYHLSRNDFYIKFNIPTTTPTPLITEISKGYRKLCNLRKTTNRLSQESRLMELFDEKIELTEGTYNDNVATIKNDLSLVSEMISDHFLPFRKFTTDSKWLLLRNYFPCFITSERAVNSARMFPDKNDPRILISSQHYINLNCMDKFFDVPGCKSTPKNVALIFEKTFTKMKKLIVNTMVDLQLNDDELAGFFGILFWSEVLDGVNTEEEGLILQAREAIFEELYYICRCRVNNSEELGIRYGKICNLIPLIKRLATELSEDFSVVKILNIFDVDTFIQKLLPSSF